MRLSSTKVLFSLCLLAIGCATAGELDPTASKDAGFSMAGSSGQGGGFGQGGFAGGESGGFPSGGFGASSAGGAPPATGGTTTCLPAQKLCSGACVQKSPTTGCGADCTPCPPPPAHATAACNQTVCDFNCGEGYTKGDSACLAAPACTDGTKNGNETDVDCGGGTCPKCDPGKACSADTDCSKGPCESGKCGCTAKTCASVTGCSATVDDGCGKTIDCSDSCASPKVCFKDACCTPTCPAKACGTAADDSCGGKIDCTGKCSATDVCYQDQCCTPQGCNGRCGSQTDCGQTLDCGACDGSPCVQNSDCANKVCFGGVCTLCHDGKMDGNETDVDCGGPMCAQCAKGMKCKAATDCATGTVCCPSANFNCFLKPDGTCQ